MSVTASDLTKLYLAYFGRPPNFDGLQFYAAQNVVIICTGPSAPFQQLATEDIAVPDIDVLARLVRAVDDDYPWKITYVRESSEPCPTFRPRWMPAPAQALPRPQRAPASVSRVDRRQGKRKQWVQAMRPRPARAKPAARPMHAVRLPRMIRELRSAADNSHGTRAM